MKNFILELDFIPPENKLFEPWQIDPYLKNCIDAKRKIMGVLKPRSQHEVSKICQAAHKYKVALHPISTGNNWGYGSSLPQGDEQYIVDLSLMNRIHECREPLSYVSLEPGVTQQDLYNYLKKHQLPFMVPTTGAGPQCSVIGNALERGFGITPFEDHFGSVLRLQAVLPDGSIYESGLKKLGGYKSDKVFPWKLGPYLEGLFSQSSTGIVTQATIALARKPERVMQFIAFADNNSLEDVVYEIGQIKSEQQKSVGGINLLNRRRLLSMIVAKGSWDSSHAENEVHIRQLAKGHGLPDWVIVGGVYGTKNTALATKRDIKKRLKKYSKRLIFLDRTSLSIGKKLLGWVPSLKQQITSAEQALDILEGKPSPMALPLAYLKSPQAHMGRDNLNPAKDGAGVMWYAPLVPMDPAPVRDFCKEIERTCLSHDIDPLITLTTLSERCFDATIPILFDPKNEVQVSNAKACYKALIETGKTMGIFPYRLGVDTARDLFDKNSDLVPMKIGKILKDSLDPNGVISPGRYTSLK